MERIEREMLTVSRMIAMYCRWHHRRPDGSLCDDCRSLLDYAGQRLRHCPKGNAKSSCRRCDIPCYSPAYRDRIRAVMRYAGPRMLFRRPLSALRHFLSELR